MTADVNAHWGVVKERLQAAIFDLLRELKLTGKRSGIYWLCANPTRHDRHAGSMWVIVSGNVGVWKDEATGDTGDVFKLIGYINGIADNRELMRWCLSFLGDDPALDRKALERRSRAPRKTQEQVDAEEAARVEEARRKALGLWLNAKKDWRASVVETYFRTARGLDLSPLTHLPGAVRWLPDHDATDSKTGEVESFPCILTAMTLPNGSFGAVHRTWIRHDGSDKAWVSPPRKIWPSFTGCVMRVAKGIPRHTPEQAAKKGISGPVVITEGLEDALTVAVSMPEIRVWAAGTLGNIAHVPALPCVSEFIVLRDNDWDKPQAVRLFDKGIQALRRHGLPVKVTAAPSGKDANDLYRGKDQSDGH